MNEKKITEKENKKESIISAESIMSNLQTGNNQEACVDGLEKIVLTGKRYMRALSSIIKMAYDITNNTDWVNQSGKPYLLYSGSSKIQTLLSIKLYDVKCSKDIDQGPNGEKYLEYTYEGYGEFNGSRSHEIGIADTTDALFSKAGKLSMNAVKKSDIKKKAHTNFMNRITKNLIGLYHTWDEIAEITDNKINVANVTKVSYDKDDKNKDEAGIKKMRNEIREMLTEACQGDNESIKAYLIKMTQWTDKTGNLVRGKESIDQLTKKQVVYQYPRIKSDYDNYKRSQKC